MTFDKITLGTEYERRRLSYDRLTQEAEIILAGALKKESIDIISITRRVKSIDSFFEKITRKKMTNDFFKLIDDLAGVRLVCKYYSQLESICRIIEREFEVITVNKKTIFDRIDQFGYLSDHYIVKLKIESIKETEKDLMNFKCEIQVRTLLMHSWATVSHELDYKHEENLEEEIRREMYAISGLLYVADQRFDSFRNSMLSKNLKKSETKLEVPFDLKQNLTSDKVIQYLEKKFPDRGFGRISEHMQLTTELVEMNYQNFEKLDSIIDSTKNVLLEYEKKYPPNSNSSLKYDRVGAVRICIGMGDDQSNKSNNFYVIDLEEFRKMVVN